MLVVGIDVLFGLDGRDFFPDGPQTSRARRQVVFNQGVELLEVVAGDSGIHVMLRVVVHLPIEEAGKGV